MNDGRAALEVMLTTTTVERTHITAKSNATAEVFFDIVRKRFFDEPEMATKAIKGLARVGVDAGRRRIYTRLPAPTLYWAARLRRVFL